MKDENMNFCKSSTCCCLNLRRASQALTKIYNRFLEPCDLKVSQYSLIKNIGRLEPVNVSDLASEMRLDRTTLVRNLRPLEGKGLIADLSARGTRDRQLVLTSEGKNTFSCAYSLWLEAQRYIESSIGKEELGVLSELLLKIEKLAD